MAGRGGIPVEAGTSAALSTPHAPKRGAMATDGRNAARVAVVFGVLAAVAQAGWLWAIYALVAGLFS